MTQCKKIDFKKIRLPLYKRYFLPVFSSLLKIMVLDPRLKARLDSDPDFRALVQARLDQIAQQPTHKDSPRRPIYYSVRAEMSDELILEANQIARASWGQQPVRTETQSPDQRQITVRMRVSSLNAIRQELSSHFDIFGNHAFKLQIIPMLLIAIPDRGDNQTIQWRAVQNTVLYTDGSMDRVPEPFVVSNHEQLLICDYKDMKIGLLACSWLK
jgi:hypothetical protein